MGLHGRWSKKRAIRGCAVFVFLFSALLVGPCLSSFDDFQVLKFMKGDIEKYSDDMSSRENLRRRQMAYLGKLGKLEAEPPKKRQVYRKSAAQWECAV